MANGDFIVCALATTPRASEIENSLPMVCETCGEMVMVAPTGQRRVLEGFRILCIPCFSGPEHEGANVLEMSPDQVAELKAHMERGR